MIHARVQAFISICLALSTRSGVLSPLARGSVGQLSRRVADTIPPQCLALNRAREEKKRRENIIVTKSPPQSTKLNSPILFTILAFPSILPLFENRTATETICFRLGLNFLIITTYTIHARGKVKLFVLTASLLRHTYH